ncbi:MAG TPA: IclR family transcriptional regulator [Virgibacillus sp.]|nr:IclR family transcriptional regulator [Virgibacillus sp.]HLR67562.1 IclR family transcriptional regulator [Virgibacillus sp.]
MKSPPYNSSVISKAFAILRAFADEKPAWGVNELARYLDIPASSLHRNLKILRQESILEISSQTGKYKIGPEFLRIASIVSSQVEIKNIAKPFLEDISSTFNESVYLGIYHPQHKKISFVEGIHSHNPLQYVLKIGALQPIHIAASGKTVLAFLENKEIQGIFEDENVGLAEQNRIRQDIQLVREQGFLVTLGERLVGASGTAAPIFNSTQKVIGCITCVIPLNHYNESPKKELAKRITEGAEKISRVLGYREN